MPTKPTKPTKPTRPTEPTAPTGSAELGYPKGYPMWPGAAEMITRSRLRPEVNLHLTGPRGTRAVAKGVYLPSDMGGDFIVHCDIYGHYARYSTNSWGVRVPLLLWMQEQGITKVYLYHRDERRTYYTTLGTLLERGTRGKPDEFGQTVNLRKDLWASFPEKVTPLTYVPDAVYDRCPRGTFADIIGFLDVPLTDIGDGIVIEDPVARRALATIPDQRQGQPSQPPQQAQGPIREMDASRQRASRQAAPTSRERPEQMELPF
jgi:hypothetical protein